MAISARTSNLKLLKPDKNVLMHMAECPDVGEVSVVGRDFIQ